MHLNVFLTSCLLKLKAVWDYVAYLKDAFFFIFFFYFVWFLVKTNYLVVRKNGLTLMKYTLF